MVEKKTFKEKCEEMKEKAKEKFQDVKEWCGNHKAEIAVFGPVFIKGAFDITKGIMRNKNQSEERRLKDNYVYDRDMGHYYETDRKLKSSEWLQFDERKAEGENVGHILEDMNVLKK